MTSGRRDDLLFVAVVALVAVVVTAVNTMSAVDDWARAGRPIALWEPLVWEGTSSLVLVLLAPAVLAFTRRAWPLDRRWPRTAALHLAGAVVFSLVHVAAMGALRASVYALAGGRYDALGPLGDWPYEFRKDLITYATFVALYVAWRLLRQPAAAAPPEPAGALEVRDGARRHFVRLDEVAWIEAAGNYVELHRAGGPILHRAPLSDLERQLAGAGFVRIHRSRLVRRAAVAQVESRPSGDYIVRLHDGRELAGSRRFRAPLLDR